MSWTKRKGNTCIWIQIKMEYNFITHLLLSTIIMIHISTHMKFKYYDNIGSVVFLELWIYSNKESNKISETTEIWWYKMLQTYHCLWYCQHLKLMLPNGKEEEVHTKRRLPKHHNIWTCICQHEPLIDSL